MKKTTLAILAGLALSMAFAGSAFAGGGGGNILTVPDGGSSALLIALSIGGLALFRKRAR